MCRFLPAQIPKVQKDSQVKQLFALSGSALIKVACTRIDEIEPRHLTDVARSQIDFEQTKEVFLELSYLRPIYLAKYLYENTSNRK